MKKNSKHNIILWSFAAVGLILFAFLLHGFYPYKAANVRIDKRKAFKIASGLIADMGHDLDEYHNVITMDYDLDAFVYFQNIDGFDKVRDVFSQESDKGFANHWHVSWFNNLPRTAPQERFFVDISGDGHVIGYNHQLPITYDWQDSTQAHLSQETAFDLVTGFFAKTRIDTSEFIKVQFSSNKYNDRTDHSFTWEKQYPPSGKLRLVAVVRGNVVTSVNMAFEIDGPLLTKIKSIRGSFYFMRFVFSIMVFFIFGLFTLGVFLKKYHDGEVEVKTGVFVFSLIWGFLLLNSLFQFRLSASHTTIGELSYDGVSLFIFIFLAAIVWPIISMFGFTSWCIGESFGRESYAEKFRSIDALLHKKFFTIELSHSLLKGYAAGSIVIGIISLFSYLAIQKLNCLTFISGYDGSLPVLVPFLIPIFVAISSSLLSEVVFRLAGNLLIYKYLKSKLFSVIVSSIIWVFFTFAFWNPNIVIYPIYYEMVLWFIVGLFFGYLFWQYDFLTVVIANGLTLGVLNALPMLTSPSPFYHINGIIALGLLLLPLLWIPVGFIKKEHFQIEKELVPEHIRRITERVKMARELEIARQVQMQLLPKSNPQIKGLDIAGICLPAQQVGGDYYDFIDLGKDRLGIVIGDVSGKGIPAAFYMTYTKGVFQSYAQEGSSPKDVLKKVNSQLYGNINRGIFVSLFYAVLDLKNEKMYYSRAGHNPVFYLSKKNQKNNFLLPEGIALGLEKGVVFNKVIREHELDLESGDVLVFFTDGFTETMDRNYMEYGEERLLSFIDKHKMKSANEIMKLVSQDIKEFAKDKPQHDDMSMIVIKIGFNGADYAAE